MEFHCKQQFNDDDDSLKAIKKEKGQYKMAFVGGAQTGKTSLLWQLARKCNKISRSPSDRAEYHYLMTAKSATGEPLLTMQLWDIASVEQRRKQQHQNYFYNDVDVLLIVFSVADVASLVQARGFARECLIENAMKPLVCILVGNKTDVKRREVNRVHAQHLLNLYPGKMYYYEVSAYSTTSTKQLFEKVVNELLLCKKVEESKLVMQQSMSAVMWKLSNSFRDVKIEY